MCGGGGGVVKGEQLAYVGNEYAQYDILGGSQSDLVGSTSPFAKKLGILILIFSRMSTDNQSNLIYAR